MKDLSQKEQFVELRAKGKSFHTIASDLGVSKTTLISWSKELAEDIANQRELEADYLREKYKIGKEHRMKLYSEYLEAVRAELAKRDFSDVPTLKLMELQFKVFDTLQSESQSVLLSETTDYLVFDNSTKNTWFA